MTAKSKIDPDAAPASAAATGVMEQWLQKCQKPRSPVPSKASRGAPLANPKFYGTCNGLKSHDLVLDSADLRADCFIQVRYEIAEYVGNYYTDVGDVWWTLKIENMKNLATPSSMG